MRPRGTHFYEKDDGTLMIAIGADPNSVVHKKADETLIEQYHVEYARYEQGKEEQAAESLKDASGDITTVTINLPSRAIKPLEDAGIAVEDLPNLTEAELLGRTEGIGEKTLEEIKQALADAGLSLKAEE